MGSSGSGNTTETTVIRFAPYIESYHAAMLYTVVSVRNSIISDSPYADYTDLDVDKAMFGVGYAISNFASLYDMYGKFMAGLDVDALFGRVFNSIYDQGEISNYSFRGVLLLMMTED